MELGEQVVALEVQLWRLTSITSRAGPESVYNLEVAGEHVYYVGSDGLLVHNLYVYAVVKKVWPYSKSRLSDKTNTANEYKRWGDRLGRFVDDWF